MKKILLLIFLCAFSYFMYKSRFWITESDDLRNAHAISQRYLSARQKGDYKTAVSLFPDIVVRRWGGAERAAKKIEEDKTFRVETYTLETLQKIPANFARIYAVPFAVSEHPEGRPPLFHSYVLAFRFSNESKWQMMDGTELTPHMVHLLFEGVPETVILPTVGWAGK